MNQLTARLARELLDYDPATGVFTWRVHRGRRRFAGRRAGAVHHSGYLTICIAGHRYQGHRLAWLYVHGQWPKQLLGQKNDDRADCRLKNLEERSRRSAGFNRRAANKNNRATVLGVSVRENGKFAARIAEDARDVYLGTYDTSDDAALVYLIAKQLLALAC